MTTLLGPSLQEIADGSPIPESTRAFFRERMRVRLHQFLLRSFVGYAQATGSNRADLAERIDKRPEQVTRWLGQPRNLTLDTVSDLLLAMGLEPTFDGHLLAEVAAVQQAPAPAMFAEEAPPLRSVVPPVCDPRSPQPVPAPDGDSILRTLAARSRAARNPRRDAA